MRLALWTFAIAAIVVPWRSFQNHPHWIRIRWVPFVSPPVAIGDVLGNVLLYVPYGYFASSLHGRFGVAIGVIGAIVVSCMTELTQVFGHGRFPSVQDVLMNITGAIIGIALHKWTR